MPFKYTPQQWADAHKLYTEELLTLREVSKRTGIKYDRLAQKAAQQEWHADQEVLRARQEDTDRIEGRLVEDVLQSCLDEEDPKVRTQLIYAYDRMRRLRKGSELPRNRKREVIQDFLVELFAWLREEVPEAVQAIHPAQDRLKAWIEARFME